MFSKTSEKITCFLKENNSISSEQYEICRYGIQQGLIILLNIITVVAIGGIMGMPLQAIFFFGMYAPLRSFAGGFHALTPIRCYIYSIIMMFAVLLALKVLIFNIFTCNIIFILSCAIVIFLSPIEDLNKPLDSIEQKVYKKRTIKIVALEASLFGVSVLFKCYVVIHCLICVYITMIFILCLGKIKNIYKISKISSYGG